MPPKKTGLDTFYEALDFLPLTRTEHAKVGQIYMAIKKQFEPKEPSMTELAEQVLAKENDGTNPDRSTDGDA